MIVDLVRHNNICCWSVLLDLMCSSAHVDNGKKDILIIGVGPKQGSDNTTLTAEKEYIKTFGEKQK